MADQSRRFGIRAPGTGRTSVSEGLEVIIRIEPATSDVGWRRLFSWLLTPQKPARDADDVDLISAVEVNDPDEK